MPVFSMYSVTARPLTATLRTARKTSPAPALAVLFVHLLLYSPPEKSKKLQLLNLYLFSLNPLTSMEYSIHSVLLTRCPSHVLTATVSRLQPQLQAAPTSRLCPTLMSAEAARAV